jgi:valyl-tRNA synthetase
MYIISVPPAFTTGKPHKGHLLYLVKVDVISRTINNENYLVLGYDTHGLPTKCKVAEIKSRVDIVINPTTVAKRFSTEAIKEFEKLVSLLKIKISQRWTSDDIFYQIAVDNLLIKAKEKELLYKKYNIQEYCAYCEQYLANSEMSMVQIQKQAYEIKWLIDQIEYTCSTTKPYLLEYAVALVFPQCDQFTHLKGKIASIPALNLVVPVILDNDYYKKSIYSCYFVAFCGSQSDFKFIIKHNLSFKNYINVKNNTYLKNEFTKWETAVKQTLETYLINKVILPITSNEKGLSLIHSERGNCKKPIEYHYSEHIYINVQKLKTKLNGMCNLINITPIKYKKILTLWIENARDWCISRRYSWANHIYLKPKTDIEFIQDFEDIQNIQNIFCDVWVDSSIAWYYTANCISTPRPVDLQIQGYEILNTWAYYSMIAAIILDYSCPFYNLKVTSLLRSKDGSKYSKSSKNYESPIETVNKHGLAAVRLWALLTDGDADQVFNETDFVYCKSVYKKYINIIKFSELNKPNKIETSLYYESFKTELTKIYEDYINELKKGNLKTLPKLIKFMCKKLSTEYISRNIKEKELDIFRTSLKECVIILKLIFEPIFLN